MTTAISTVLPLLAGNTEGSVWLSCLHPLQAWPLSFHPYVTLPHNGTFRRRACTASAQDHAPQALAANNMHVHQKQSAEHTCAKHMRFCALSGFSFYQHGCIRAAGWILSCAAAILLQHLKNQVLSSTAPAPQQELLIAKYSDTERLLLTQIVNGFWATAAAAMASDLLGLQLPVTRSAEFSNFYCGNFGIMVADAGNHSIDTAKVRPHI